MPDLPGNGEGSPDFSFQSAFTNAIETPPVQPAPQIPVQPPPPPVAPPAPQVQPPVVQQQQQQQPVPVPSQPQVQPPAATPQPTVSEIAQAAARAGFDVTGKSDAQIASEMATGYAKLKPYAEYGQQLTPFADEIREYFAAQQQQAQQPQPQAGEQQPEWTPQGYFKQKWNAPAWDEKYDFAISNGMVQRNSDTGLYEATPGFEVMVGNLLPGMNQAQTFTHQQWQGITRGNPYENFYNVLLEPMEKRWQSDIDRLVEQKFSERESRQMVDKFESDNATWLYQADPATGQKLMTQQGQAFYNAVNELKAGGVSDPTTLVKLARQMVNTGTPQLASAPPATPQPTPVVPAQQSPAIPPPDPALVSAQRQQSFLQNAMDRALHSPNSGGYAQQAPDHPINVSEVELNNMFSSEFSKTNQGS